MATDKTQTKKAGKKKQAVKETPKKKKAFTKKIVKEFIIKMLQKVLENETYWLTKITIHKAVNEFYEVSERSVGRYISELTKDGYVQERFLAGAASKEYSIVGAPHKPTEKEKPVEKVPDTTIGDLEKENKDGFINEKQEPATSGKEDFKELADVIDDCKVIPGTSAMKSVCGNCTCGDDKEELTIDKTDTDTPPAVVDVPIKAVRTKNAPKYQRADCLLTVLKNTRQITPSELISKSDELYVAGGGVTDVRKQTQVYKIVAKALIEVEAAEIDVMGRFSMK